MQHCSRRCANRDGSKCTVDGRLLCGNRKTLACVQGGWEVLLPVEPRRNSKAFNTVAMAAGVIAAMGCREVCVG